MEGHVCWIEEASCIAVQVLSPDTLLAGTLVTWWSGFGPARCAAFGQGAEHFSHLIDLRYQLKPLSSHARPMAQQEREPQVDWK